MRSTRLMLRCVGLVTLLAIPASVRADAPINGLEFVGKVTDVRKARFLLLYPTRDKASAPRPARQSKELADLLAPVRWVETSLKLDFAQAASLPPPAGENAVDLRR